MISRQECGPGSLSNEILILILIALRTPRSALPRNAYPILTSREVVVYPSRFFGYYGGEDRGNRRKDTREANGKGDQWIHEENLKKGKK